MDEIFTNQTYELEPIDGGPRLSVGELVAVVFYGIICAFGILGNLWLTYVILRFRKMRTTTNIYVLNVSLANLCVLAMVPFLMETTLTSSWGFGSFMCTFYMTLLNVSYTAYIYTVPILCFDHVYGIPKMIGCIRYKAMVSCTICLCIWIVSVLISLPTMMYGTQVEYETYMRHVQRSCMISWPDNVPSLSESQEMMLYDTLMTYIIPDVFIIVFSFLAILNSLSGPKRPVTWLVLGVCIVAIIFPAPLKLLDIIGAFMPKIWEHRSIVHVWTAFNIIYLMHAMILPYLYPVINVTFRKVYGMAMKCASETEVNELFPEDEEPEDVKKPGGHNMVTYSYTVQVPT